jgi:7-carboxy-7-deazaguanine synthase
VESLLSVNEIFGPTFQGEGPFTGQTCIFVRLAICPLRCKWCDTWYTWAWTAKLAQDHQSGVMFNQVDESHSMTVSTISMKVRDIGPPCIVVISGGEPLVQTRSPRVESELDTLGVLAEALQYRNYSVHIETAGIRLPGALLHKNVTHYVVSPKLASSGNALKARHKPEVLEFFAGVDKSTFKFVVTTPQDLQEIDDLVSKYKIPPRRVMLMPEGTLTRPIIEKMVWLAPLALEREYGISTRLHVLIWGDKRGH